MMTPFLKRFLRPVRLCAAFILIAGLAGCGLQAEDDPDTQDVTTPETSTLNTYHWPHDIGTIENDISRLRGLPIKNKINVKYMSREELSRMIEQEQGSGSSGHHAAAEEKLLKVLGLVAPGEDLSAAATEMLGQGIAGFYDDDTKELSVISSSRGMGTMTVSTIAHETTHALQDQSFDLQAVLPDDGTGDSDRDLARRSLVEGDATRTMDDYMDMIIRESKDPADHDVIEGADTTYTYLEDQLEFPYTYGERFVEQLKGDGGWESIDAAYGRPPESTEQIMHPSKYMAGERPLDAGLPDLGAVTGPQWSQVEDDVVGEFDVMELIKHYLPSEEADAAAAGWGGGRYRLYQRPDGSIMFVMLLAWDSDEDTTEFHDSMKESLAKRYGAAFKGAQGTGPESLGTPDGTWVIERKGRSVVVVIAPDGTLAAKVAAAVMEAPGVEEASGEPQGGQGQDEEGPAEEEPPVAPPVNPGERPVGPA